MTYRPTPAGLKAGSAKISAHEKKLIAGHIQDTTLLLPYVQSGSIANIFTNLLEKFSTHTGQNVEAF